jgi:hypothetical protein
MTRPIFVLLFAVCASAPLQDTPQHQRPENPNRRESDSSSHKKQSATLTVAATSITGGLNKAPADNEKAPAKEDTAPTTRKSLSDVSATDIAIAFFALCGVIVGGFQWNAMKAAVTETKRSATQQSIDTNAAIGVAKDAADAAKESAGAAKASVEKMDAQTGVMTGQLDAMRKQLGTMESEFLATHRPRIVLRRVTFHREDGVERTDQVSAIKIELANVGEAVAKIVDFAVAFQTHWKDQEDAHIILRALEQSIPSERGQTIANGGSRAIMAPEERWASHFTNKSITPQNRVILCVGYICYTDAYDNTPRRTGFMVRCDAERLRWVRTEDPDFEYTD